MSSKKGWEPFSSVFCPEIMVTEQHYVAAGASDRARARKMLSVISGGKKESRG